MTITPVRRISQDERTSELGPSGEILSVVQRPITGRAIREAAQRLMSLDLDGRFELLVYVDGSGTIVNPAPGSDYNDLSGGWDRFSVWSDPGRHMKLEDAVAEIRRHEAAHQQWVLSELANARSANDSDRIQRISRWVHGDAEPEPGAVGRE
jgi:hypothetical protein